MGASVVEIGLFYTAFSLITVLLRPLVGWGLDRFGRRVFFITGVGGCAVTMFSLALIDRAPGIILARVLQGTSSSLIWLTVSAMTADTASQHGRGSAFETIAQARSRGLPPGRFWASCYSTPVSASMGK
jgi:MFS family permease